MRTTDTQQTSEEVELRTYVAGVAGGLVGVSLMVLVFFAVDALTGESFGVFRVLADLTGADEAVFGFLFFVGAGALVWPLLFVTAGRYLPGSNGLRGVVFALCLWTGFLVAFGPRYSTALPLFVVFSLAAHLIYGYTLGFVTVRIAGPLPDA